MSIIVTGAAGFIGANLVKALNARGLRDIIAVDNLTRGDKFRNLVDCELADYLDIDGNLLITNDPFVGVTAEKGILSFPFRRFYMELNDLGLEEYIERHLPTEELTIWKNI